jgi:hypothetical protein
MTCEGIRLVSAIPPLTRKSNRLATAWRRWSSVRLGSRIESKADLRGVVALGELALEGMPRPHRAKALGRRRQVRSAKSARPSLCAGEHGWACPVDLPGIYGHHVGRKPSGSVVTVDDAERRELLKRHWDFAASNQDITHEIYHDDAVLEFPQSGERFEGVANFREWRRIYPTRLAFETRRVRGEGDLWVVENSIRYGDGAWQPTVNILEFRGDKVARETVYVTEQWDAPEWRSAWRAAP